MLCMNLKSSLIYLFILWDLVIAGKAIIYCQTQIVLEKVMVSHPLNHCIASRKKIPEQSFWVQISGFTLSDNEGTVMYFQSRCETWKGTCRLWYSHVADALVLLDDNGLGIGGIVGIVFVNSVCPFLDASDEESVYLGFWIGCQSCGCFYLYSYRVVQHGNRPFSSCRPLHTI